MKKVIKRVLLVFATIIILIAGTGLYFYAPMLAMKPAETGQIPSANISAVKNGRNAVYFIKTNSGYIMVDAGTDPQKLETSITESGIDSNDVNWVLLTHSDYDHVAGLPLFPNAQVYLCRDELPLLNGAVKRSPFGGNKMPAGIDINTINLLSNGQELSFGGTKVECMHAPGHTPGSMLYLIDGKYLFTGDAFKVSGKKMSVHPFTMDAKTAKKTIEQMQGIISGSSIILTAHYGYHHGF